MKERLDGHISVEYDERFQKIILSAGGQFIYLSPSAYKKLVDFVRVEITEKKKQYTSVAELLDDLSSDNAAKHIGFLWGENLRLKEELEAERLWIKEGKKLVYGYREKIEKLETELIRRSAVQEECGCWVRHNDIVKGLKIVIDKYFESPAFKECEFCGHKPCGCGG